MQLAKILEVAGFLRFDLLGDWSGGPKGTLSLRFAAQKRKTSVLAKNLISQKASLCALAFLRDIRFRSLHVKNNLSQRRQVAKKTAPSEALK
ncbi:MAG: hypothetical protein JWO48_1097 [Bryobacterales bacterium]|nr:hypothetical protein [Bryobacterales bacterium]